MREVAGVFLQCTQDFLLPGTQTIKSYSSYRCIDSPGSVSDLRRSAAVFVKGSCVGVMSTGRCSKGQIRLEWRAHAALSSPRFESSVKNGTNPSTFSSRITTDIPLYESQGASFDQYLTDRPRVFQAIFPDKRRSQRLNAEEWRIQMLPINFLFLTVWPVIDMRLRCKSSGEDYPTGTPSHVTRVLELDVTRWKLQGLDNVLEPSQFKLEVRGALYPDRQGMRTRLKGQLEMEISFVLPTVLALVPEDSLKGIGESVLKRLVENMKHRVNGRLLSDYSEFKREKPKNVKS
ncbi:uncharacterized protein LOC122672066 [Telopea speciosissima]|uniref:uncharacterized protein LOC122672066 n=1 Tax=Telopea speciosissima TaxID=54955 RepID=UPI001CC357D2|nr:uncharacterized protein LOC122672066 [Telopea speciosissima]